MGSDGLEQRASGQTAAHDDSVNGSGVLQDIQTLWNDLRVLTHDHFRLAALEARQAGESLVSMIVAGAMLAVLLCGAWLGLMAAAVLGLVENGVVASSAILLAVACNLLLALILCGVIRRKSRYLQFPAVLRSLQPTPSNHRNAEKS